MKIKFPHISRRISAPLLFYLLLSFFLFNLFSDQFSPKNLEKNLRLMILRQPENSQLHEKLAEYYLSTNWEEAQKEYLLASSLYEEELTENSRILGVESSPLDTWNNLLTQRNKVKAEIGYWEKVAKQISDYQYTFLMLSSLYLSLGEKEEAFSYLDKVIKDPPSNSEYKLAIKQIMELK